MPAVASLLCSCLPCFAIERARDAAAATVYIRVIGTVRVELDSTWSESLEERNVELGTGSGFVFTPYGHVLTNQHVVAGGTFTERVGREEVRVELSVEKVEVVFPSAGESAARYEATIEAMDPALDLAVLAIAGGDVPYLALGDSEVAEPGDAVSVYGFPFGGKVEVGKASLPDIVPTTSTSRGAVSATRSDETGNTAYLQTTATVNPGNSGGPMVDELGYVLGVIRLKLREGDGIGFAIPVNAVKEFLETNGYGPMLPVEWLRLGGEQTLEGKGLALRLPETMDDRSPARVKAQSDPGAGVIEFVSDRVATEWSLRQLEELLLGGGTFGPFHAVAKPTSKVTEDQRTILGSATGRDARLEYALFDLGREKVLVRYRGPSDDVAFNRSVLVESLRSVRAEPLLTREIGAPVAIETINWVSRLLPVPAGPSVILPDHWEREESAPFPCQGRPPWDSVLSASPPGDFTVSFRVGWWAEAVDPIAAARGCRGAREASYAYAVEWLGVGYTVEGAFRSSAAGLLQLEIVSPREKHAFLGELSREWLARNE